MVWFLYIAIKLKSPVDLYTFVILSTMCNCYLIFRDLLFIFYPDYYVVRTGAVNTEVEKYRWLRVTKIDIIICLVC